MNNAPGKSSEKVEKYLYSSSVYAITQLEKSGDFKAAARLASDTIHFALFKMMEPIDSHFVQSVVDKRNDLYCRVRMS